MDGVVLSEIMFGDEANPYRSLLDINYPIEEGRIKSKEDFAKLWDYSFSKKMGINPSDYKDKRLLVTEAALNTRMNREMMAEIIFEEMNFGACMFET